MQFSIQFDRGIVKPVRVKVIKFRPLGVNIDVS